MTGSTVKFTSVIQPVALILLKKRKLVRFKNVKRGLCNLRQKIASLLFSKDERIRHPSGVSTVCVSIITGAKRCESQGEICEGYNR